MPHRQLIDSTLIHLDQRCIIGACDYSMVGADIPIPEVAVTSPPL